MKVKDIMTEGCYCVTLKDNVYEISVLMAKHGVGFVPVVDTVNPSKLIGVVTDRDLVCRGYAMKKPGSTAVSEVMTADVITTSPNELATEAADIMAHYQIRRLPVVDQGKLVGVVALRDIALSSRNDATHVLHEVSEPQHTFLQ